MPVINAQGQANIIPTSDFVFVRVTPNNLGGFPGFVVSTTARTQTGSGQWVPDQHDLLIPKPLGSGLLLQGGGCLVVATIVDQNTQPNNLAVTCEIGQGSSILFSNTQQFALNTSQTVTWAIQLI